MFCRYILGDSQEFWGYCSERCHGEQATPKSEYNLAKKDLQIWESAFYDLRTWESGLCHTYNPPQKSAQGPNNRLFFMLGNKESDIVDDRMLFGFEVYIHEKGQFWQRSDMHKVGQPDKIVLELDTEMEVSFSQHQKTVRPRTDRKCEEDSSYSFTSCLNSFIKSKTNCRVNWFDDEKDDDCSDENLGEYVNMLIRMKDIPLLRLSEETGCYQKCKIMEYNYQVKSVKKVDWATNWTSSFYLQPLSSSYEVSEEFYSYDDGDLVGDVGGYLGLFLGWSLLSVIGGIPICLAKLLSKLFPRTQKEYKMDV